MLFDSWQGLGRVLVVGILAYVILVLMLRISGKRTLTKLNAFDLVVTVALGSTLSSIIVTKSVALAEGVLALALLIGLQYVITWLSVRSPGFQRLVKSEPKLLVHCGRMLHGAMKQERVTEDDVIAAIRGAGAGDLSELAAVVLETDGSISVLKQVPAQSAVLHGVVQGFPVETRGT